MVFFHYLKRYNKGLMLLHSHPQYLRGCLSQRKMNGNKLKRKSPNLNLFYAKLTQLDPFLDPEGLNPKIGLNKKKWVWPH